MKIAIICPTKGRPSQCLRMIESAKKTSTSNIVFYIGVQGDLNEYEKLKSLKNVFLLKMYDWTTCFSWNLMADKAFDNTEVDFFMLGADDMVFYTAGWDMALINHYKSLRQKPHVYSFQDSRDVNGTPHPIMTREWVNVMGYFVSPIFLHWYVDTWNVAIAKANGVFTHFKDYLLYHDKPSDDGHADETHKGIRERGWNLRDGYLWSKCNAFLEYEKKRMDDFLRKE